MEETRKEVHSPTNPKADRKSLFLSGFLSLFSSIANKSIKKLLPGILFHF
jgi:hypothetical protein